VSDPHVRLFCSQCGRSEPTDPDELRSWKHGDLVSAGEIAAEIAAFRRLNFPRLSRRFRDSAGGGAGEAGTADGVENG
jgi:hypothetical protein